MGCVGLCVHRGGFLGSRGSSGPGYSMGVGPSVVDSSTSSEFGSVPLGSLPPRREPRETTGLRVRLPRAHSVAAGLSDRRTTLLCYQGDSVCYLNAYGTQNVHRTVTISVTKCLESNSMYTCRLRDTHRTYKRAYVGPAAHAGTGHDGGRPRGACRAGLENSTVDAHGQRGQVRPLR